ncbi:DUF72 domain-containing protein [Actinokineospora bangkokensis]|uniref:DUF72 domain-containing protein n=1 Tax=Actinokineospora bangkokensis TaxID=1193682 RepID=A0A1Q9LST2_9PSEU|nr:DUF72 domain-containing protein [Actinokineospora bangkokensis]OLR95095.1 hypothetical protein BJP25_08295 [Actinokineospora bangkokensis]
MTSAVRIGTSGWVYPPWRGRFYPPGLPQRDELAHLAGRLGTVEVNGTFYGPRKPADYRRWAEVTPDDFVFAVKGPREVTHEHRLRDAHDPLKRFVDSGVTELGAKLGPVLWQTPASLRYDPDRVERFLDLLVEVGGEGVRHAVEVRHRSFHDDRFADQLTAHGVALVLSDSAGTWPCLDSDTAAFRYLRLHGEGELYRGAYSDEALDEWAERIRGWAEDGPVFAYFDNTMDGHAPEDALRLTERL